MTAKVYHEDPQAASRIAVEVLAKTISELRKRNIPIAGDITPFAV